MSGVIQEVRNRRRWLIAGGAGLVVALGIGLYVWHRLPQWRLSRRVAALREAGEPVALDDLGALWPDPPTDDNAAGLYERAAALRRSPILSGDLEGKLPIQGPVNLPEPWEPFPPDMLRNIRAYLEAHKLRLALLHEAAAKPQAKFPVGWSQAAMRAREDRIIDLRDCARLLALEAVERAVSGQTDQALEACRVTFPMARALRRDPWQISAMVGTACEAFALRQLEWVLARAEPSPEAARRLQQTLDQQTHPDEMARLLTAERTLVVTNHWLVWRWSSPTPSAGSRPSVAGRVRKLLDRLSPPRTLPFGGQMRPLTAGERLWCVEALDACLAAARSPHPGRLPRTRRACDRFMATRPARLDGAELYSARLGHWIQQVQSGQARIASARVALATLRHKARHGRLPEQIGDLVPGFLDAVPADPFDGQPLRYQHRPGAFVVYSVGHNREDDGGELGPAPEGFPDVGFRVRWPPPAP